MPKTTGPTPLEMLKQIAAAWNADELTKDQIARAYGHTAGWLDNRLSEARAAGLMVIARRPGAEPEKYSQELLDKVADLLRRGAKHPEIMRDLGRDTHWVSYAKYLLKSRGVDLSPVPILGAPTFDNTPARTSRPVLTRIHGGIAISLPYLRCLDPEAPRA